MLTNLLERLDAAEPSDWETEYARTPVATTRDSISDVVASERPYADWLAFRFDAGPPGVALPPTPEAIDRLTSGQSPSPLDAYVVAFKIQPNAALPDSRAIVTILFNASVAALGGGPWFAQWLAARAGLAAVALGFPEFAWKLLDLIDTHSRRHPQLDKLVVFEPTRSGSLDSEWWVRATIFRLWPHLQPPSCLPMLPLSDPTEGALALDEIDAQLAVVDATTLRQLVAATGQHFAGHLLVARAESAQPEFTQIRSAAEARTRELDRRGAATRIAIERASADLRDEAPSDALCMLIEVCDADPLATLVLTTWASRYGDALSEASRVGLRGASIRAIMRLRNIGLYEWRVELIDAQLAEDAVDSLAAADLLYQRACAKRVLKPHDREVRIEIVADLDRSRELRQADRDLDGVARALAMLASVIEDDLNFPLRSAALLPELRELLQCDTLEPLSRALVLQALSVLTRGSDQEAAISFLKSALDIVDPEDPLRLDLLHECAELLVRTARPDDALALLIPALSEVAATDRSVAVGLLFAVAGQAHASLDDHVEALKAYESSLAILDGIDPENAARSRVHMATLHLRRNDVERANACLASVGPQVSQFSESLRADFHMASAAAKRAEGDGAAEVAAFEAAASAAPDRCGQLHALLGAARLQLERGIVPSELDAIVIEAIEVDDLALNACVLELCGGLGARLGPDALDLLIDWAKRNGQPYVAARVEHNHSLTAAARARLRSALLTDLPDDEAFKCAYLLMTISDDNAIEERLRCISLLEGWFEQGRDEPHVRIDIATTLRMLATRSEPPSRPSLLRRAEAHMRVGLSVRELESHAVEVGEHELATILAHRLIADPSQDSERAADIGNELLELPGTSRPGDMLISAAAALLTAGGCCHPAALKTADNLLNAAGSDGQHPLSVRLNWIRACVDAGRVVSTCPSGYHASLDELPDWLFEAVVARDVGTFDVPTSLPDSGILLGVLRVRPDRADAVVSAWLRALTTQPDGIVKIHGDAIYHAVQAAGPAEGPRWTGVRKQLQLLGTSSGPLGALSTLVAGLIGGLPAAAALSADAGLTPAASFKVGVAALTSWHSNPDEPLLAEAQRHLESAVDAARREGHPILFDALVSLGNASRSGADGDVGRALALYGEAASLPEDSAHDSGKLNKVWADALLQRGSPDDVRLAAVKLDVALAQREGWQLAETHVSAAIAALHHPDHPPTQRYRNQVRHLTSACDLSPQMATELLPALREAAATLRTVSPDDELARQTQAYLVRAGVEDSGAGKRPVFTDADSERLAELAADPAFRAYMEIRELLSSPADRESQADLLRSLGPAPAQPNKVVAIPEPLTMGRQQIEIRIAALESRLAAGSSDAPGTAAALVQLHAHLVRVGHGALANVRAASATAVTAIQGYANMSVRVALTVEIASVWAPDDHLNDPVRDFPLSAELAKQAVDWEGGPEAARDDSIGALARGLRYSPATNTNGVHPAVPLFEALVQRGRESGTDDVLANRLCNLADAISALGRGSRSERALASLVHLREAADYVKSPRRHAFLVSHLAWAETEFALMPEAEQPFSLLQSALERFDSVVLADLDEHSHRHFHANRAVCEGALVRIRDGARAEVRFWRAQVAGLVNDSAHAVATAKHNLANALLADPNPTARDLQEVITLCEDAIGGRRLAEMPGHHWETAQLATSAYVHAISAGFALAVADSHDEALHLARTWNDRAIVAAKKLGTGSEFAHAALMRCEVELLRPKARDAAAGVAEAWKRVEVVRPYLLLSASEREREARVALRIATSLADRFGGLCSGKTPTGVSYVLSGSNAATVANWFARAQAVTGRLLRARLRPPAGVSQSIWRDWTQAVSERDHGRSVQLADQIRGLAPEFLASPANPWAATTHWLESQPDSATLTIQRFGPAPIAVIASVVDARLSFKVVCLRPPLPPGGLPPGVATPPVSASDLSELEAFCSWSREAILEPLMTISGQPWSSVLWSPGPCFRRVPPALLFPGVAVATSAAMTLSPHPNSARSARATLLAMADPKQSGVDPLGDEGQAALRELVEAARSFGPTTTLATASGGGGDAPTAERLLNEAGRHDLIVLLAHGKAAEVDGGAILLVDDNGNGAWMSASELARRPHSFDGAVVVLLSCDAGHVGNEFAQTLGVAGTLLSAGAVAVVAPLWPVGLEAATSVGISVLRGIADGLTPWEALQGSSRTTRESPTLGRPPTRSADRDAARRSDQLTWVTWVR